MNRLIDLFDKGLTLLFGPSTKAHAVGVPQDEVHIFPILIDGAFASTPTLTEIPILACPDGEGCQLEMLSVSFFAHTVPADSNGTILGDLEHVDDSDSDTVSNIAAAVDFEGLTARVTNQLWRGSQILDPGDTVNFEMATDGAISTPSVGAALLVEYKVKKRSGA